MKRFSTIVLVWALCLIVMISGKATSKVEYAIHYDSHTKDTYEVKKNVEAIYRDLVSGVHKESYILMVLHNKDRFAYKKNMSVSWKNDTLLIKEGDGQGDHIKGELSADCMCVPKVQPRSWLEEMFS